MTARACSYPPCVLPVDSRGLCKPHAARQRRGASLDAPLRVHVRFDPTDAASVRRRLLAQAVLAPSGCLLWTGAHDAAGYGQVGSGGRVLYVHPLAAFAWAIGGDGPNVLHDCDTPPCFAPTHLYRGTQRQNVRDMWDRGRAWQQRVGV